jgi:hypothetical protein
VNVDSNISLFATLTCPLSITLGDKGIGMDRFWENYFRIVQITLSYLYDLFYAFME